MTLNEVYLKGRNILQEAGCDAPAFDTMCILNLCFNLERQDIILHRNDVANKVKESRFFELICQRAKGRPLQYILGRWNFMGNKFKIGEGVLVPRDDTEVLVNVALEHIRNIKKPQILDLCAGPGTIAISLATRRLDASVVAVELSAVALRYLKENIKLNSARNVTPKQADVLFSVNSFGYDNFDLIVSNPPYIPTDDLKKLQKEVQNEPQMALDGGKDGLKFYRAIAGGWTKLLKKEGYICVEVGQGQSQDVINIFEQAGLIGAGAEKDLNGINRVVFARRV